METMLTDKEARELNEACAKKLGWDKCEHSTMEDGKIVPAYGWRRDKERHFHEALPDYVGDISAAWELVEFAGTAWLFSLYRTIEGAKWRANFGNGCKNGQYEATEATAPLAIVRAFLKLP